MPSVVVGTNAYADVATIDEIADNEMYMSDWLGSTDNDIKARCIITGTRLLEEYLYTRMLGSPVSLDQPLLFPRSGLYTRQGGAISSVGIPDGAVMALAKISNLLLTTDLEASQKTGLASGSVGPLNAVFDKYDREGVIRDQVLASLSFCLAPTARFIGSVAR